MPFAEVAVNAWFPHRDTYTYEAPPGLDVRVGQAVYVPFGRKRLQGVVLGLTEAPQFDPEKLVAIEGRIEQEPLLSPERVDLARWLSRYYLAPPFPCAQLMLPPGFEQRPLTWYDALPLEVASRALTEREREVWNFLSLRGSMESEAIRGELGRAVLRSLDALVRKGAAIRTYSLAPQRGRRRVVPYVRLVAERSVAEVWSEQAKAGRAQAEAVRLLLLEGPLLAQSVLRARSGITALSLRSLVDQGLVAIEDVVVERDPLAGRDYPPRPAPALTAAQAAALRPIVSALHAHRHETFLLHGVTGSGKTEVYLSALERAVAHGGRGIVLVPEIALTPQTVQRFAERFPGRVAVMHSGLSLGQRFDQWWRIYRGDYDVVVGARSALFAPVPDLSLIVLDEEHEWTYKQHDAMPRYHARETAEQLAMLTGAVLVLGSATPDVVSYHRAEQGRYQLLELRERLAAFEEHDGPTGTRPLPDVEVVDMREELRAGNRGVFSRSLHDAIDRALRQREQIILFLNRRGSAGFLLCRDCGHVPSCSSCGPAYAYHADIGKLVCHQCGRSRGAPQRCSACESPRLRPVGIGTQRLEEEVSLVFPDARILRWDRDVTRTRGEHERILTRFLERQADVLIGTQMVAKGLDLPFVTVVGVVAADIGLHVPDYRSGERTYQVLSQVAGRAGRGPSGGRVVIQTYAPDHYAIRAAATHDYGALYAEEIAGRRSLGYPPFGRLAQLTYTGPGERKSLAEAQRVAHRLSDELRRRGEPGGWVRGPAPAFVPRWRGQWRWNVLLRAGEPESILDRFMEDAGLRDGWEVDIDPASLA